MSAATLSDSSLFEAWNDLSESTQHELVHIPWWKIRWDKWSPSARRELTEADALVDGRITPAGFKLQDFGSARMLPYENPSAEQVARGLNRAQYSFVTNDRGSVGMSLGARGTKTMARLIRMGVFEETSVKMRRPLTPFGREVAAIAKTLSYPTDGRVRNPNPAPPSANPASVSASDLVRKLKF